jgi:alpha-L-rhamnosidase
MVAKIAKILGKVDDAKYYNDLKDRIATAFIEKFYDKENKTFGSQTANAMALDFGLVPVGDENAVSADIVRNINEKYDGFFHNGIFGMGRIGQALSRYGNARTAWNVFTKKGVNSFAYMWDNAGATSLWEILPVNDESIKAGKGASYSHPMLGGYDTWFYEDIAGIRPDESRPGFKVIRFEPTVSDQLQWAKATIDTPYGKTTSDWSVNDGKLTWKIIIPPNASGLVALPVAKNVTVNGEPLNSSGFIPNIYKDNMSLYNFPSGSYIVVFE